jgi:hypothetical protein
MQERISVEMNQCGTDCCGNGRLARSAERSKAVATTLARSHTGLA